MPLQYRHLLTDRAGISMSKIFYRRIIDILTLSYTRVLPSFQGPLCCEVPTSVTGPPRPLSYTHTPLLKPISGPTPAPALKSSFKSSVHSLLQTPHSLLTFLIRHYRQGVRLSFLSRGRNWGGRGKCLFVLFLLLLSHKRQGSTTSLKLAC